jgi:hypothetical protein
VPPLDSKSEFGDVILLKVPQVRQASLPDNQSAAMPVFEQLT